MKDKTFLSLSIFFFVIFFAGVAIVTLDKPTSQLLRASSANPSSHKSFAVVFPQVGVAGNKNGVKKPTEIKAVITIRDVNGNALSNRKIKLTSSLATVEIAPSDIQITNDIGQAIFFLTSSKKGKAKLQANDIESNTTITNIPTIEFIE